MKRYFGNEESAECLGGNNGNKADAKIEGHHREYFVRKNAVPQSGTFHIGGDLPVHRLGFGAMRITGDGIWGEPRDHDEVIRVLRRALELGINFIDTADSYGPEVSERLIAEAL